MNNLRAQNPVLGKMAGLNAAGNVMEDITTHLETLESVKGGTFNSAKLGNEGAVCTATVECMWICYWF